ncbi:MAG TPA: AAA family ATPase [Chthoniobacterales bacterium]|jgi:SpoVK/Ycf46/Vps4 family AAA+-type ATPase
MSETNSATIAALREALRLSPSPLLEKLLADHLLAAEMFEDAEPHLRAALSREPADAALKFQLVQAFHGQGKRNEALVLLEDITEHPKAAPEAILFHARLLFSAGEIAQAVNHYHRAVEADPKLADYELARRLGIGAQPEASEVVEGRVRAGYDEASEDMVGDVERPKETFTSVGGMEKVKEEVRLKIIYPLQHPEMYRAYGKKTGGGILLYGPPGCGKTHLARATAGEIKAGFISVGINDVLEMWIGSSERNLHALFEQARATSPCVLFFDEVDALGASRSDMKQHAGRQLINQFLSEMDGVTASNEGILILAATNAPWHLDSAFRRPGRFDRILFVPPPDLPARVEILQLLCAGKPVEVIDFAAVAKKCPEFSGADLRAVVETAIEKKLQQAMREGVPKPLSTSDLIKAAGQVKPSTREWFATAKNYALYSNQGGTYDEILQYLKDK